MPVGQLGTPNLNTSTFFCNVYQGLNSITPLALSGSAETGEAKISWALGKLAGLGLSESILGCPTDTISTNFLYPNQTTTGGPLGPAPVEVERSGNNVYYKTYFTEAPKKPACPATKAGSNNGGLPPTYSS